MMNKPLIIYFSLTGNTELIAKAIQEAIGGEILSLELVKELIPNRPKTFIWCGFQALLKRKPELKPIDINLLDYDLIFLGTPVWASTFSAPIRSFLHKYDLKEKNIAIWTSAGGNTKRAIKRLKKKLQKKDANVIGEILFKEPKENNPDEAKQRAINWAKNILNRD